MSDTINLAGKDIIVDHVTTNDGPDTLRALQLMNAKRNRNGVDDLNTSVDNINDSVDSLNDSVDDLNDSVGDLNDSVAGLNGSVNGIMGKTCRIGARASGTTLDVYAYNPLNRYSANYSDDYYVTTGYVECNGQTCPVSIPTKHISFSGFRQGTWSILIKKADPLDEVWSVYVAIPEPDQNNAMKWKDTSGNLFSIDTSVWVIGFFTFSSLEGGVYNLFVSLTGTTPTGFLKDRFMQVMNDCDGADTDDFTNWAIAMKCDAIFKRLAALEAFVDSLTVNKLEVGGGTTLSGFLFRAKKILTDDGQGNVVDNSVFDVYYNGEKIFCIDVTSGKITFGSGFEYNPVSGAITALGAQIKGNSYFQGSFDCDVIKTKPGESTYTDFATSGNNYNQAKNLLDTLISAGFVPSSGLSGFLPVDLLGVTSPIKYMATRIDSGSGWSVYYITFYDSNFSQINLPDYVPCTESSPTTGIKGLTTSISNGSTIGVRYATNGCTIRIYHGGNLLKVNIPSSDYGLEHGLLYYDPQTGAVKMKI